MDKLSSEYSNHRGKVSFKWSSYLNIYERSFDEYRNKPVAILEIGVQNGGSLEILAKHFPSAKLIVGCDTNPACGNLNFNDPRIHLVVGDATQAEVAQQFRSLSPKFDIIIDDGSHRSLDIIRSFVHTFPLLASGGLYVVEDLHASYWLEYEGGLYHPYSAMTFLKRLADVLNHEHWGVPWAPSEPIKGIASQCGVSLEDQVLSSLHSVEFVNSMCLIRKRGPGPNSLGHTVIAGSLEDVTVGHSKINNTTNSMGQEFVQDQNPWTNMPSPPDEMVAGLLANVSNLQRTVHAYEFEIAAIIHAYKFEIAAIKNSKSWRVTVPFRWLARQYRRLVRV